MKDTQVLSWFIEVLSMQVPPSNADVYCKT